MVPRSATIITLSLLLVAASGTSPPEAHADHSVAEGRVDGHEGSKVLANSEVSEQHQNHHGAETHHADDHGNHHAHSHGNHDPHGHGNHHAHGHESKTSHQVSKALAAVLLCTVAWVMCLFYYVNSPDEDIVRTTWLTLSEMVSIFMAVLLFNAMRSICLLGHQAIDHHAPPTNEMRLSGLVRMICFVGILSATLYFFRFRNLKKEEEPGSRQQEGAKEKSTKQERNLNILRVVGTLGAHFLGFAMIEVFGAVFVIHFEKHVLLSIGGFVICLLIICLMHIATSYLRTKLKIPGREEDEKEWREVCAETENESASLAMGLVLSLLVRFAITGHMPPVHGGAQDHTSKHVWILLACALIFGMLLVVAALIGARIKKELGSEPEDENWRDCCVHRISDFTEKLMIMSMGWCLLFWGKWFYWELTNDEGIGTGSVMSANLVQVMMFSVISFTSIRYIDRVADLFERGSSIEIALRRTITMFGLLMGLSWETTFTSAVEAIGSDFEGTQRVLLDAGVTLFICLAVLPAWAWYILPKTIEVALERQATALGEQSVDAEKFLPEWEIEPRVLRPWDQCMTCTRATSPWNRAVATSPCL